MEAGRLAVGLPDGGDDILFGFFAKSGQPADLACLCCFQQVFDIVDLGLLPERMELFAAQAFYAHELEQALWSKLDKFVELGETAVFASLADQFCDKRA